MNNKLKILARQQKPQQTNNLHPFYEIDIVGEIGKFSQSKIKYLDLQLELSRRWPIVAPSQQWLADQIGVSREYVNRLTRELVEDGVLSKQKRFWKTCRYYVNDFFSQPHIRKKLAHLLPSILTLIVFPLSLLVSRSGSSSSHYLRKNYFDYISIANSYIYIPTILSLKKDQFMNKSLPTVKGLNLTRYGKIKLCVYPQEAIAYAETELATAIDIRSPLGFVHSKCKEWCMKHGRKIEWGNKYKFMEVGETFRENEPEIEMISALKVSYSTKQSSTEDSQQEEQVGKSSHLKPLSYYIQRDETIQHYNPGKGYSEQPTPNADPEYGAELYIKNIETAKGAKALRLFGFICPFWDFCTQEQKGRLLLKYPFIAEHINKPKEDSWLLNMAQRIVEYNKAKQPSDI